VTALPRGGRLAAIVFAALLSGLLVIAAAASAATRATVTASAAKARGCHTRFVGNRAHTDVVRVRSNVEGLLRARLKSRGDWDLGVFDAKTKRYVAGSAALRGNELAEGFVTKGQRLLVQACRFRGRVSSARVSVSFLATPSPNIDGSVQVVDVSTPTRADKRRLQALGLDLTESGDANSIEVVLYGNDDVQLLRRNKFRYTVRIADLQQRNEANRRADRRYRLRVAQAGSQLPSGSTQYRRLPDFELELKLLAGRYPSLVKPLTLPHRTHLGRDVQGIEIATNPYNLRDGKPIFLNMGTHHAREWPSAEHSLEWAYDLLTNYGNQARTTRLVRATRNIVIPVVNPDGFNISREAPDVPPGPFDYEFKRKNCWPHPGVATGTCENSSEGRLLGVDLNRNYGGFWGGSGASVDPDDDTFRGTMPFSEPETENIRKLHSERQITNLITNHTFSNLVLRPPGVADVGPPLEEPLLADLGARMTSHNGYSNIPGFGLYDTTGSTEDWTFWTAGGLGYTFEIGAEEFHPPYQTGVVAEYLGLPPAAGAGQGGNREAYYEMLQATADTRYHSLVRGRAPNGWTLKVKKSFMTSTSPVWQDDFGTVIGNPMLFPDSLESELHSNGGRFSWHMNPSTRPVVAGRFGRDPTGPPQGQIALANPAGQPAENTEANHLDGAYEAIPFTVAGPPEVDNGRMAVHIQWSNPETDWDLYVVNAAGEVVTQSASFGDTTEDAVLFDPPPGQYTAHVVNYDQVVEPPAFDDWSNGSVTFASPRPLTRGPKEAWTLTCEDRRGRLRAIRDLVVDRGDRVNVGRVCSSAAIARAKRQ
jgi:murein tripeptide amidase MpaA